MNDERNLRYAKSFQTLIRCETVSVAGDGNPDKFRVFHALLKETFPVLFSRVTVEDFDGSLLLRWPAAENTGASGKAPILLMSHHDVVEASGAWTHAPFSGDIADGKIWGRGTLDTKNTLWAMLQAAEELAAEGYVPSRDIYFESACTEETSGSGADTISRVLQDRGIEFAFVLDEGGYIVHDPIGMADHDFAVIGVGEKGCADLKFIARSVGGHASMPGKDTPLVRLGKFMAYAEKADLFPAKMNDVTIELFRRSGAYASGAPKVLLLGAGFFAPLLTALLPKVSTAAGAMLKTTLAFTQAGGSEGRNVLPREAYVVGNMRYSHHQGGEASIAAVRKAAEKFGIETEILDPGFSSDISDYTSPEFKRLEKTIAEHFPGVAAVPYVMTGASDCRFMSRVSKNCFRFAPFRISDKQLSSIHGIDENLDVDGLSLAVDFYKHMIQGD